MNVSTLCAGAIVRTPLPDGMTPSEASTLAVAALNAGAAQLAKGAVLRDPSAYGGEIVARGIASWKHERWSAWESAVCDEMARLDGKGWRAEEPDIEAMMDLLVHGGGDAGPLVPAWTRLILGHALGSHPIDECRACRFAADGHGLMLVRACERNERTLRNLYDAMASGGFISRLPAGEPRPIADVDDDSPAPYPLRVTTQLADGL
jgi:hypothetical protein